MRLHLRLRPRRRVLEEQVEQLRQERDNLSRMLVRAQRDCRELKIRLDQEIAVRYDSPAGKRLARFEAIRESLDTPPDDQGAGSERTFGRRGDTGVIVVR